jgi:hypothetical protein
MQEEGRRGVSLEFVVPVPIREEKVEDIQKQENAQRNFPLFSFCGFGAFGRI